MSAQTTSTPRIPEVQPGDSSLTAALKYAEAGLYIGPVVQGTKHPGSRLGKGWQLRSSRDPEVLRSWYQDHPGDGVFLHVGRSGLVAFDVDQPDNLHPALRRAFNEARPPFQTTRAGDTERGHHVYALPPGRSLGNGLGGLGKGWGEVRGRNGVIIVAPTVHPEPDGFYAWQRVGLVPPLPEEVSELMGEAPPSDGAASDREVAEFLDAHSAPTDPRPALLTVHCDAFIKATRAGESRHNTMVGHLTGALKEAAAGLLDARVVADTLESMFLDAVSDPPNPRSAAEANSEWRGLLAWGVAQAQRIDVGKVRERADQYVPPVESDFSGPELSTLAAVHRGQARMAYRLADAYAGRLMYVAQVGWHAWDGKRWAEDTRGATTRAVLKVLRKALAESVGGDKALCSDVRKCESEPGIRGVLGIAAALEPFAVTVNDLDVDPYLLNCANGTLDLRTLELRPHNPDDHITKVTRAAYDPATAGRSWGAFLDRVLPDVEVREFLARYVGQGLAGRVLEHRLAILTGTGRNGKGVFYGAVGWSLGDYAVSAEPDLFMHREGAHPTGEMDLRGRRWVVVSESDAGRHLAEATVKRLTGGDRIRARRMRQDFVEFDPSHTAALVTNHLPKVTGDDPALWARLRVVPFEVVIPEAEQDPHLPEKLQLEADAVLTWAVQGWTDYQARGGLAEPPAVAAATGQYHIDSDAVARFLADETVKDPKARVLAADLYARWERWGYDERDAPALSKRAFGLELDRRGYDAAKDGHGARVRRGLRLQDPEEGQE